MEDISVSVGLLKALSLNIEAGLTKAQLREIINKVNALVDSVNILLKQEINLNQELNKPTTQYRLSEALNISKGIRKAYGMRLRFLSLTGKYVDYTYIGPTLEDEDWTTTDNWTTGIDVIDGGEF